ncbi:methenyltetrahydrofolate synthetase [Dermacentor variabilis]|uniref:methenyltetrahydrofolate synthetase n=1 Tax=Dermacentor variabilis TaxID=34621 RepID=UPI003F5B06F9
MTFSAAMAAASLKAAKNAVRAEMKKQLKSMTAEDRLRQSKIILDKFVNHSRYKASKRISIFVNMETEVSTEPIIRQIINDGKECFIPKYDDQSQQMDMVKLASLEELWKLPMTKWRIKQHTDFDPREEALVTGGIDLLVVPAVAFAPQGARLGHGKGYYDIYYSRCLKAQAQRPYTLGLCFCQQIVPNIPLGDHDMIVDEVLHA